LSDQHRNGVSCLLGGETEPLGQAFDGRNVVIGYCGQHPFLIEAQQISWIVNSSHSARRAFRVCRTNQVESEKLNNDLMHLLPSGVAAPAGALGGLGI
jgi:hypothetical protein